MINIMRNVTGRLLTAPLVWALSATLCMAQGINIQSFPTANTPFDGSEVLLGNQDLVTKKFTAVSVGASATSAGSYSGQLPQTFGNTVAMGCLNIFTYLTSAQQAAIMNGTSTLDMQPYFVQAENSTFFNFQGTQSPATRHICVPAGKYLLNETWNLKHDVWLTGEGGGGGLSGTAGTTTLVFAANIPGIIVNRFNTLGNATISPTTTGADGSIIEGLSITDATSTWTDPTTAPAIWRRARAVLRNVNVNWTAGNGVQTIATGGVGGAGEGNANEWRDDTVNVVASGHCFYTQGGDTNGGESTGDGAQSCGLSGFLDLEFLGSHWSGVHADAYNVLGMGEVTFGGHNYSLISATAGIGASTTPGTNNAIWYDLGTGSGRPAWSSGGAYYPSAGIIATGANTRSVWSGPYVEVGGPASNVFSPGMVIGGNISTQFTVFTPHISSGNGIGGVVISPTGMGGFQTLVGNSWGSNADSYAAYDGLHVASANFGDWRQGFFATGTVGDYVWQYHNLGIPMYMTTSTAVAGDAFGRTSGCTLCVAIPKLALGIGSNARILNTGSGAPSSTGNAVGEPYFNIAPTSGGCSTYVVTAQGTPDTYACTGRAAIPDGIVSALPAASTALKGATAFVTDASASTYAVGAAVTGGGGSYIKVYCNGSAWVAG